MIARKPAATYRQHILARPAGARALVLSAAELDARGGAWDDLVARALTPHPHFSRHVVEAHRASGLLPRDLAVATVWTGDRLDAVLPFRLGLDIVGLGAGVARPALSPYMPSSAPLVAADGSEATLAALAEGLTLASRGRVWRWPLLTVSGQLGQAWLAALREAGWRVAVVDSFERPVLERRESHAAFLAAHPHKSRLKDLRRRERRLAERGTLALATATGGPALADALGAFLALEAAGWKGRAGTALACRPRSRALAETLFAAGSGPVTVRADTLALDGRAIAVSLALVAGGTACLLKTAYDEAERALAPGLVLEAGIVRALHETGFAERLDSASLPGSALESLHPERETVAEIVAQPPGPERVPIERRAALARFEHRARAEAKRRLGRG